LRPRDFEPQRRNLPLAMLHLQDRRLQIRIEQSGKSLAFASFLHGFDPSNFNRKLRIAGMESSIRFCNLEKEYSVPNNAGIETLQQGRIEMHHAL
jgi:hypothetical protein